MILIFVHNVASFAFHICVPHGNGWHMCRDGGERIVKLCIVSCLRFNTLLQRLKLHGCVMSSIIRTMLPNRITNAGCMNHDRVIDVRVPAATHSLPHPHSPTAAAAVLLMLPLFRFQIAFLPKNNYSVHKWHPKCTSERYCRRAKA